MPPRTRGRIKKESENEEKNSEKMSRKVDVETQTDPEITGVDSEDFETDSEDEEEDGDETERSEDEQHTNQDEESANVEECTALASKGTSSKPIPRKKIELKYYFGDDMPDAELKKLTEAEVIVPPGLEIKSSNIPEADLGVFAKCVIPKHEFFGPYVGRIISAEEASDYRNSPHVWEVRDDYGKLLHLIDGRNAFQSNWLRYVNCAQSPTDQNIAAVQYDNSIYYMASKDISIGEEMLTWYGEKYAKKMGLKGAKKAKIAVQEEESFTCKNCNKMYTNPASLIGHLKFKCNTGQQRSIFMPQPSETRKNIPKKIEVTEEYAREQNEKLKKFKCNVCSKGFIRNYTLQCHMLIHKGVKEHKCDYKGCGKEFTLLKHLQRHKLVHTGEKPYKCHLCGRAFSQQGSLQAHSRTHTGVKPYKCKTCGRAFALQSPLLSHMKTHSSVKSYKCETCGKSFTHRNTLARHELIHTGLRPYKCDQCGKTFTQTNDLKRHNRIHTGIRPYKCHICGKAFTVEFTLVCHIRTHTGIRPYKCDYCDKSFTQPGARLKHVRKVHPDLPVPIKRQEEDQEAAAADAKAMKALSAMTGKDGDDAIVPTTEETNSGFDEDSDTVGTQSGETSVAMDTTAAE